MYPTCIHAYPLWLPQTQSWMYHQYLNLPTECRKHVVCRKTLNLEQYNVLNLHSMLGNNLMLGICVRLIERMKLTSYQKYLGKKIKSLNAEIVHSHFGPIGVDNMHTVNNSGARHVITFYGADVTQAPVLMPKYKKLYLEMFEMADLILCEGPHMASVIRDSLGCPRSKLKVQRLGIDLQKIPFKPREWDGQSPLKVLIAGTFREKKGIPYALLALSRLNKDIPLEITIYGDATGKPGDAEEKQKIFNILRDEELMNCTTLKGFQPYDELIQDAYNHHVFISPSVTAESGDTEGGAPVTIIEMVASGMPVVSSLHCDIPQVVPQHIEGWLSPEKDIDGLYRNLYWLITNKDDWKSFLIKGREHIEASFDAKIQGKNLNSIYQNLC